MPSTRYQSTEISGAARFVLALPKFSRVPGLGYTVKFRVQGLGFRIQGLELRGFKSMPTVAVTGAKLGVMAIIALLYAVIVAL